MQKNHKNAYGQEHELQTKFRTNDEKYELLARLAYGQPSLQGAIDERIFRPGWQRELIALRMKQRAHGIPDEEFLHSKRRKELGLPVKNGRRKALKTNGAYPSLRAV